ncbi:MAG: nucleotidyltransferase domain-containing protein [Thermoleophilia bacterium]|nr:nucleotidyltransferase domain-containing protein [Thermoleophilia bacterium]
MDLGAPYRVIETPFDMEVIRVLSGTTGALSGRRVAGLVRTGSRPTVLRSLNRLAGLGLLDVTAVGRANMFSFNREHLAAPALEELMTLRRRLIDVITEQVRTLTPPPRAAGLFGSAARGDGDEESDLDILLISDSGETPETWQLHEVADHLRRRVGNVANLHTLTSSALASLVADDAPIIADLRRDYVPVLGQPAPELFAGSA